MCGLNARQFNELLAYASIEPFGEFRSELRHGQIMALTHNLNRDPKKQPEPYRSTEFMNFHEPPPERQLTPEEIEAHFDAIFGK